MNDHSTTVRRFLDMRVPDVLLEGFFLSAVKSPESTWPLHPEQGITASIESNAPCVGTFYFCAPLPPVRLLGATLLGSDEAEYLHDIMGELSNVVAGRIALDLQDGFDIQPKLGLPKVGPNLFPDPETLDVYLRFRVEDSHLVVGWKAIDS